MTTLILFDAGTWRGGGAENLVILLWVFYSVDILSFRFCIIVFVLFDIVSHFEACKWAGYKYNK